ncbi:MAG: translation initiation factor IF-2 [Candidatus Hadarchaeum sp.]|uniref:translation initiation factor IF-2 n=1 Tax=Candidatus Hadarchaeum sp. TaxID=2883567 RepID=UPI003170A001
MQKPRVRQPLIAVLGHVDHGKTSLLDAIRGTRVAAREAGAITQHVGASEIPIDAIRKICGKLLERLKIELTLPGLLFIDTPGHEAFTNLRRRGGSLADLATLVIDINEGFMPQTLESLTILRTYKTPFMVIANKIDLIPGWKAIPRACFLESFAKQRPEVQRTLDEKVYELVGKLHELGFESERFDRVSDFRRQVSIVPASAKTGEGIAEILTILSGLAQRYLEKELMVEVTGPGRGTVLEVKEEVGLGKTIDVIIYDGVVAKGDLFAVGGLDKVITSKVRCLLQPKPLDEIRDPEDRFNQVEMVYAAAGVKIAAPNLEGVVAGAPFLVIKDIAAAEKLWQEMQQELERVRIISDVNGVVLKADALGSLEALEGQLKAKGIPIRKADVGDVSRRDVIEAATVGKSDQLLAVVLAFNVKVLPDAVSEAEREGVQILRDNVIYRLLEQYESWVKKKSEEVRANRLQGFVRPGKIVIKPGYVFRRSDPAIVGIDVLGGVIRTKAPLMNKEGKSIGSIRELQKDKKPIQEAKLGDELAVSIDGPMIGRQVQEGDVLYTDVPRDHVLALRRDLRDLLSGDELSVLDEIIAIKQKTDPTYGVM